MQSSCLIIELFNNFWVLNGLIFVYFLVLLSFQFTESHFKLVEDFSYNFNHYEENQIWGPPKNIRLIVDPKSNWNLYFGGEVENIAAEFMKML